MSASGKNAAMNKAKGITNLLATWCGFYLCLQALCFCLVSKKAEYIGCCSSTFYVMSMFP